MKGNTPVYIIKPKYIFKSPFLKYDLQNPTNRQAQNEELTEYYNYGFNEDTMNIYAKFINRTLKVLDYKKNLQYFDQPSELMRLNDQIPMDLGGFCKFYDPQVFKNDFIKNDQQLFKNFLFNTFKATCINGKQYPMLQFVKSMYQPKSTDPQTQQNQNEDEENLLPAMIQQISKNLQKKYEQTMKKLIQQKNQPKQVHPSNAPFKKGGKFEKKPRIIVEQKPLKGQEKKKERKQSSSSSSGSQSSSSSSSDSSSSSQSEDDRRKRYRQKKQRDSSRRDKPRSGRRQKSKEKRSKSDKKQSRHGSRNQQRDRSKRERQKKRSDHRSRSRDHKRRR